MNQGILSNNDNFIFPKGNDKFYTIISNQNREFPSIRESIKKIGTIEYYSNGIFGLNQGFSSFNNISGVNSTFLSSSTGIIRENSDLNISAGFVTPTRTTGIIPAGASGVNYDNFSSNYGSSIIGYLTTNNYNWNPDKFCVVVDTTKNPGGLYFDTVPCCTRQNEFLIIDWGDDSLLDQGYNSISVAAWPHLYKKHGIYIIQISMSAGYFAGANPFNGGIGGAASEALKSTNNSVIGILSMGNPPYVHGFKDIFTIFGAKLPNLLFIPNKLPRNINSRTSPIDSFGLSNNIEILTLLFFQRRLISLSDNSLSDRLDYSSCESWDTSDIKYFLGVFRDSNIKETNLSKWNTSQALSFELMFDGAIFFQGNGLEYWNTSKCTSFSTMFRNCTNFNSNLSGWDVSKATDLTRMFETSSFRGNGLETWNVVTGVTSMFRMFTSCPLNNITISGWSPASGCNHTQQFISANISGSYLPNWTFAPNSNCASMFQSCNLTNVSGLESWNTSGITNMGSMFSDSINFNNNLSGWNVSKATNISSMFNNCTIFAGSGLENWSVGNGTNFNTVFRNCSNFNSNLSGWNVSSGTIFLGMFIGCSNFRGSGLENWNVGNGTNFSLMFVGCPRLGSGFNLDLSNWNVGNGTNFSSMFSNCSNFDSNLSGWNVSSGTAFNSMFANCINFRGSGLENWNVGNGTNFDSMLASCTGFNANLSGWNVSKATNLSSMFGNCRIFAGSGVENWNVGNVTNFNTTFRSFEFGFNNIFNVNLSGRLS